MDAADEPDQQLPPGGRVCAGRIQGSTARAYVRSSNAFT